MQCRVLRNGKVETIHHNFLHVGDVINIEYGMANPVDGIVFQAASLTCDEAAMTGESDEMKKETQYFCKLRRDEKNAENPKGDEHNKMHRAHEISSPLILSGTSIAGGEGKMVCLMVGADSCIGQIISKLIVAPEVTPLQSKLEKIATDIGKMGTYIAILIVHILLFRYFLEGMTQRNTDLFGGEHPGVE
jgi:magnesium-transporting ATPase (P-type)